MNIWLLAVFGKFGSFSRIEDFRVIITIGKAAPTKITMKE